MWESSQRGSILLSKRVRNSFNEFTWLNLRNSDALGDGGFNKSNAILEFKTDWQSVNFDQIMELDVPEYAAAGANTLSETDANYPWDQLVSVIDPSYSTHLRCLLGTG